MSFREHIQQHIDEDIIVQMAHLESVTFDDICILIHLITTENKSVLLSEDVGRYLNYHDYENSESVIMHGSHNDEELAILLYLVDYRNSVFNVDIGYRTGPNGNVIMYHPEYKMSNRFILAAKRYGVLWNPCTIRIIANYNISTGYDPTEANKMLAQYMYTPKSARND